WTSDRDPVRGWLRAVSGGSVRHRHPLGSHSLRHHSPPRSAGLRATGRTDRHHRHALGAVVPCHRVAARGSPSLSASPGRVRVGVGAPPVTKHPVVTRYRLGTSWVRRSALTTLVAGSFPIRVVPMWCPGHHCCGLATEVAPAPSMIAVCTSTALCIARRVYSSKRYVTSGIGWPK